MPFRCQVIDISDGGARVATSRPFDTIPNEVVTLLLQGKVRRPCRIAWRRDGQIGVEFVKF
jgi:hypothetical protein